MLKVAITGNIAAGKSQVEAILAKEFPVYDADKIAHKFLGDVDRKALGEKVFKDPKARKKLEEYIHPKVKQEILEIFGAAHDIVFVSVRFFLRRTLTKCSTRFFLSQQTITLGLKG